MAAMVFKTTDIGRLVTINHGGTWGVARIVDFTSTTVVVADVETDFGAITAQTGWRLGLYSGTTGYPATVRFHDQRLILGGSTDYPDRFDGSKSADSKTSCQAPMTMIRWITPFWTMA